MPCIVRLFYFVRPKKDVKIYMPLTRRNIYVRDDGICQYCGGKVSLSKMTVDHVIPKSIGGKHIWKNVVCSCFSCNNRKGDKLLKDTNMKLLRQPKAPDVIKTLQESIMNNLKQIQKVPHEDWNTYLFRK